MKHFTKFLTIALMVIGSAKSFAQNVRPCGQKQTRQWRV